MEEAVRYGKNAYMNTAIAAANILFFIYLELIGSTEDSIFMIAHGAMFSPLILGEHQYSRLITSVFMHFGAGHLMNNMLIKKVKMTQAVQAGLPKMVLDQTPRYLRWTKVPIVKAKIGPKIVTLVADERVFQTLPVKTEAKVVLSGLYISQIKSVRGGSIPAAPQKKGFFSRFKKDKKKDEKK